VLYDVNIVGFLFTANSETTDDGKCPRCQ